jgi:molecular chaperone DnaK
VADTPEKPGKPDAPERRPRDSAPDLVERYGRKGGSARRQETKGGIWQRMVDWVAPTVPLKDGQVVRETPTRESLAVGPPAGEGSPSELPASRAAPPSAELPPLRETPPSAEVPPLRKGTPSAELPPRRESELPRREPVPPRPASRGTTQRMATQLLLPDGRRVVILVHGPADLPGVLECRVEAAPINDPRLLEALASVAQSAEVDSELAEDLTDDALPISSETEPPELQAELLDFDAPSPPTAVRTDEFTLPPPTPTPVPFKRPSQQLPPISDTPTPTPFARQPLPIDEEPTLLDRQQTPPATLPRGPSRGGAAQRMWEDREPRPPRDTTGPKSAAEAHASTAPRDAASPRGAATRDTLPTRRREERPEPNDLWPPPVPPPVPPIPARGTRDVPARDAPRRETSSSLKPITPARTDEMTPDRAAVSGAIELDSTQPDYGGRDLYDGRGPAAGIDLSSSVGVDLSSEYTSATPLPEEPMLPSRAPTPDPRRRFLPVVGIDFGTTYSSVAVMRAGLEVIPDEHGEVQTPSVVSFPRPGVVLVGTEARQRMAGEAQFTIASPKRLLGRLYKDPQVSQLVGGLAFRTFAGSDKFVRFEAHGQLYTVADICAMILGKLRERACRFLDAEVSKAVFTVPVGFGTLQRSALEIAARQAGLEVVGILTEPSAGVLSHGFRGRRGMIAVYDFGGGTFDFSLMEITETAFQVLCAGGDTWLGGDDFDQTMANQFADQFWNETGVDLRTRAVEWQALVFACEQAKRELSSKTSSEVRLDGLLHTAKGKKGLHYKLSRKEFVNLTSGLVEKSISIIDKVLQQVNLTPRRVDAVVMTGGTSQIPAVRDAVTEYFGRKPVIGDPNLAVVKGAALRAAELSGEAIAETSMGGRTLREVAGRTIGAGLKGGHVETLFERNTPLPAEVHHSFYTEHEGQTEMVLALYEESKSRIDESRTIGHLRYKGLRPAPAGKGRVDFTFVLDEDGMLHVSAIVEGKQYDKTIKLD